MPADVNTPTLSSDPPGVAAVDDIISKSMDQNFATRHERLNQTAERFNDGAAFVSQESKQHFLHSSAIVYASAANQMEKDGLADQTLQAKTAGIFPGYLPPNNPAK